MKKFIVGGLLLIAIIIAAGLSYLKLGLPNVGAPEDIKITATPEMIARGKYLANHVAVCIDCHSTRDWSRFSGPPLSGTEGKGGDIFSRDFGFPGNFYAKNITPAGIGHWTD
ncbi:MAG TPA: cytochrome C, partial [Chitinophagales bacterium]|nr:cytochrome C [Chitinophagales bacterium]